MNRVFASLEEFKDHHPEEFEAVRAILEEYWVPVAEVPVQAPQLAIDAYVPRVVFLALDQSSLVNITDFLAESEAALLGMTESTPQQWLRCKKAAEAVIEYFEKRGPKRP